MDTEEALKAGHVVDPESEMHLCATTTEVVDAKRPSRSVLCILELLPNLAGRDDVKESRPGGSGKSSGWSRSIVIQPSCRSRGFF